MQLIFSVAFQENLCDYVKIGATLITLSNRLYIVTPIFLHSHTDFLNKIRHFDDHNNHLISTIYDHLAMMEVTFFCFVR